jgi:type IV secretion system protein VirB10
MNPFSRKSSSPAPTVSTETQEAERSVWERYRKTIVLFGGCFALLVVGRACSSHQERAQKTQKAVHVRQDSEQEQSDKNDQISLLRSQLLAEQKRSETRQEESAAASSLLPSPLTPAQQQHMAAIAANGGVVPPSTPPDGGPMQYGTGVQQQRPTGADYSGAVSQHNKSESLVISYRQSEAGGSTEEKAAAKGESAPQPVPAPESLTEDQQHGVAASTGEKYRIRQGTWLPCTEQLRINGSFAGNINCLISIPIYSPSGTHLLIPQGTVALGHTAAVASQGQQRLFVVFDTFIEPDGYTVTIKDAAGLDQIGQTGLRDKVDHHYAQMFGVGIALAAVSGLSQIGNYGNSIITPASQYRAGMTQGLSESSMRVLDRFTNILPTFVIREGARNNIHLPMSLYLPDCSKHALKGDL